MLNAFKELAPVIYGESAIKYLPLNKIQPNTLCFKSHWHDRMEILGICSGEMHVQIGGEKLTISEGQIGIVEPRTMHYGASGDNGVEYYTIMFDVEKFYNGTIASEKYLIPLVKYGSRLKSISDNKEIFDVFIRLVGMITDANRNPLCAAGCIYEMIGLLCEHCIKESVVMHKPDQKFSAVVEYINEHFTENINARMISQRFGYEETYFCRRFREITGITPMKYIKILRMEKAQKLLREEEIQIGDIAWQCGYSDISYFSNCFKKQYGVSPTEFRNLRIL